jgi:hypothetical protein
MLDYDMIYVFRFIMMCVNVCMQICHDMCMYACMYSCMYILEKRAEMKHNEFHVPRMYVCVCVSSHLQQV